MNFLIKTIRDTLAEKIKDIDSGNCDLSEKECMILMENLEVLGKKDKIMSKYQAYTYLNISRATFDNYIREGKLPRGKKIPGFKELQWCQKDLDEYIKKCRNKNKE